VSETTGTKSPVLAYAPGVELPPAQWSRAVAVPFMSLVTCWAIGAATNLINGVVCIDYFNRVVGRMYGGSMSMGDVVFQGLLEGTGFGLVVGFVLTTVYAVGTGARCSVDVVWRALFLGTAVVLAFWMLGGVLGMAWAALSPVSFENVFRILHGLPMLHKAWVGGSIWGLFPGALAALVTMSIYVVWGWRKQVAGLTQAPTAH
jgi:hypothetical protein